MAPDGRGGRERGAEATKQAIMRAAEEIFARDGFEGARVDDIAEASGYNKSLIFRYFDDKAGLYRAIVGCVKDTTETFSETFSAFLADESIARDPAQVRRCLSESTRFIFEYFRAHPPIRRMLMWEAAQGWQTFAKLRVGAGVETRRGAIARFFRQARDAGIIRPDVDPYFLITSVLSMTLIHLASLPRYQLLFPDVDFTSEEALDHAREQLVALIVRGALTHPEETRKS